MIPAEVLNARVCHIEIPSVCIEPSVGAKAVYGNTKFNLQN